MVLDDMAVVDLMAAMQASSPGGYAFTYTSASGAYVIEVFDEEGRVISDFTCTASTLRAGLQKSLELMQASWAVREPELIPDEDGDVKDTDA